MDVTGFMVSKTKKFSTQHESQWQDTAFRDRGSTASLSTLFQRLTTLTAQHFLLIIYPKPPAI